MLAKMQSNIFLWEERKYDGCFQTPLCTSPFFAFSDFVGQTSAAATGVASINVNDAGKCIS